MAKNDQELKNQEQINKLKKEELELDKKSAEFSRADVSNSDDFSSLLRDNLKNLELVAAAKSEILSIDRRITKQVNDAFSFDKKQLGTSKASNDLAKQHLQLQRDIEVLKQKSGSQLTTDKKLQEQINNTIKQRRQDAEKLLEINKDNAKFSKEISGNLSVRTFAGLEGIASKIGLGDFASELSDASKAAREAAGQNKENLGKTGGGLDGLKNSLLGGNRGGAFSKLSEDEMNIFKRATSGKGGRGSKGYGKGLTAELMEKAGLKGMGTGAGAASKIKAAGGIGGLQKALKPISPLIKGLKAFAPALKKVLGPLSILMEIMQLDKQTADMAKNLNVSYKEATSLRSEMQSIANSSGNNFVTGKKVVETFGALNKELGTSAKFSDEMLTQFTEMREMAGFTNEELMGIAKISMSTGKEMDDITGEFMAQAKISATQNGVLLNEKDLLKGMKDISAATTLSLSQNPVELAKAVATSKALGMELSAVENIASGMLEFEQSIANELQAELLTGKELNLEKARQAALDNDLATLAEEIAKNTGSAAEFGAMNRLQQDAIAKSVGMSREDLAKTLYVQEQLKGATGEQAEEQAALINKRIEEVGLAQAQKELAKDGVEGLRQQVGMADKMSATMDKLNDIFISLIEPLMPILDIFVSIFDLLGPIMKLLNPLLQFAGTGFSFLGDLVTGLSGGGFEFEKTKASVIKTEDASVAAFGGSMDIYDRYDDSGNLRSKSGGNKELKRLNDNLEKGITANTYLDSNKVSNNMSVADRAIQ